MIAVCDEWSGGIIIIVFVCWCYCNFYDDDYYDYEDNDYCDDY